MISLALLWHMHQPWYLDPASGRFALPWVRLHGTKDYLDMVELLREFPAMRVHFNLTPSLLEQMEMYGQGVKDEHQLLCEKAADRLTPLEAQQLLEIGFMGCPERMIHPYPRYFELMAKADRKQPFSVQELRDLQVWSNLTWMDPRWRRENSSVREAISKGSHFTEVEKERLLRFQMELLQKTIPAYRSLQEDGQAELTTSPWAHPILPLLFDTAAARRTNPGMPVPSSPFQFPEDVGWHLETARQRHENWFGRSPRGLWPSEGSVSQEILPAVAENGFCWMATDEEILWNSLKVSSQKGMGLGSVDLYRPYKVQVGERSLTVVFRDHVLSDLIGFVYSGWPAQQAADDFVGRLAAIEKRTDPQASPPLVMIVLDGENAWEFYPDDGEPFLRALYGSLSRTPWIRSTTLSDYLQAHPPKTELNLLHPGSWIRGEFSTWIGHDPQNRAWTELARVRRLIGPRQSRSVAIAEGSDWFWWLGPEHSSPQDPVFDRLFRSHLKAAYQTAGQEPPSCLEEPLKEAASQFKPLLAPTQFFTPTLDGELTSYFEWLHAGEMDLTHSGSAMARSRPSFSKLFWGCDSSSLYLRLDPARPLPEMTFRLFFRERRFQIEMEMKAGMMVKEVWSSVKSDGSMERLSAPFKAIIQRVLEISLPLGPVGLAPGDMLEARILVQEEGFVLEQYPEHGQMALPLPHSTLAAQLWSA